MLPGGRLQADIGGSFYAVQPGVMGPQGCIWLLTPWSAAAMPDPAALGAASEGLALAEQPAVGQTVADTQWCIKVRFGLPQGVRVIVSQVDNYGEAAGAAES